MILADYDNGLFYVYEGSNNGHLYTFIGYTLEEYGNYRGYCESRLTRNEIKALHDGKTFLNALDYVEGELKYAKEALRDIYNGVPTDWNGVGWDGDERNSFGRDAVIQEIFNTIGELEEELYDLEYLG